MKQKKYKHRDTNNSIDDEFGFNHDMNEDDYNKLRDKEQKKSMPQPQKKKKDVWVKISDGLYENQTKRKKKKEKINHFRGLNSSSRGPI